MKALARGCFERRRIVVLLWLVALIGFFVINRAVGESYSDQIQLPNTPSTKALNLLESEFPGVSGSSDQIVLHSTSGTLMDNPIKARVQRMLREVAALPHVRSIVSPFSGAGASQISKNRTIAFATVIFDEQSQSLPGRSVQQVIKTAEQANSNRLQVALGGEDIENPGSESSSGSTVLGVLFALIVLGLTFGTLLGALLPLIVTIAAIGVGNSITGLLSHVIPVASFATILGVLIGLGVGIDYALLIVTRYRAGLRSGRTLEDSLVNALNTAGRTVFFAGITVCVAILGQFALGVSLLYGVAVAVSITVALTMLASLTLLPALLGFFGLRVLSRRQRARVQPGHLAKDERVSFWRHWAMAIERQPVLSTVLALTAISVVALPTLSLRLGLDDAGSDPLGTTTRQAYDLLVQGFGPGFNGPFLLVAELPSPSDEATFVKVLHRAVRQPGVVTVSQPIVNPRGTVAVASLYPSTSPQAAQTASLLNRLRTRVIPNAEAGTGVTVLVGGITAIQVDFTHVLSEKLRLFLAVIILLGFLMLMAVFRSLLIPLVASIMNLLSVGAALGIMNAVFEWGWGQSFVGVSGTVPVEVFIPVILIAILFGLSMDYEVFLLSRIQEEWVTNRDNRSAVTVGQAETGWVVTAAAGIMILVFISFAFGDSIIIKQFGIGLAGAIIVDAFIVRTALVPALMHLLGRANWWLPKWLDRSLPHLNMEAQTFLSA